MDPKRIVALQANVPELKDFCAYLSHEANKLNTLDGIEKLSFEERAGEATARLRAFETIKAILSPLINSQDAFPGIDPKEFVA